MKKWQNANRTKYKHNKIPNGMIRMGQNAKDLNKKVTKGKRNKIQT